MYIATPQVRQYTHCMQAAGLTFQQTTYCLFFLFCFFFVFFSSYFSLEIRFDMSCKVSPMETMCIL